MFLNRKAIAEILDMEWISDDQEHVYTVLAKIVGIDHGYGWCYVSCNQCSKKLVPDNGSFVCNTCKKECCYPIIRYKIHVRVSDESGSTTFVILNQDAEKLIDSCANKFVNRLGVESNKFPEEIINLTGKTFVFKIKLTDYNLKDVFENYTVVKIFEVDDTLEAKFCGFSSDKGVESKGKRTATTMIDEQSVDFPNNVVASTETRGSICEGETSGDHVTPEKESGQMKKLKNRK
ncbi:hypothetical protein L2E82_15112 [Cichorium intybus]|uniref:Uncharacterized protein n=1 Tax=Cichorium intybus TaxID=13427 RepID=A0ACB9F350_CICIN|nr:hypothetical protein L2E82_15112 [Cichorium intybus]